MSAPRKAPPGCYWRGSVLWAQARVRDKRYSWSLGTDDPEVAVQRRETRIKALRDPADAQDAKRRVIAGRRLTEAQKMLVTTAIDLALTRRLPRRRRPLDMAK